MNIAACDDVRPPFVEVHPSPTPALQLHRLELTRTAYFVDYNLQVPEISTVGRITGSSPSGKELWLLQHPLPNTTGLDGLRGSDRFYPAGEITTNGNCWYIPSQSIGYSSAEGISFEERIVLAKDETVAEFKNTDGWHQSDGFSRDYLRSHDVETLATFVVPTMR